MSNFSTDGTSCWLLALPAALPAPRILSSLSDARVLSSLVPRNNVPSSLVERKGRELLLLLTWLVAVDLATLFAWARLRGVRPEEVEFVAKDWAVLPQLLPQLLPLEAPAEPAAGLALQAVWALLLSQAFGEEKSVNSAGGVACAEKSMYSSPVSI